MNYQLYEYDKTTETAGNQLSNTNIECGNRYKLVFDVAFSNLSSEIGSSNVNITMTVSMGDYDNNDNSEHLLSAQQKNDGGLHFNNEGNGIYTTSFNLSTNSAVDFTKTYFIVGIDTLGVSTAVNYESIGVSFAVDGSSRKVYINSANSYNLDLAPVKGTLSFTEANITKEIGVNYARDNMTIAIPNKCGEIDIAFYNDAEKTARYGTEVYTEKTNADAFNAGSLNVDLGAIIKGYIGEAKYEQETSGDNTFTVYIEITAVGGKNYNDVSILKSYIFE
jgi:hypothetical protein